jgi:hypothetical protein
MPEPRPDGRSLRDITQVTVCKLQECSRLESRKALRSHISELSCKVFRSRDPILARFLVRSVIRYSDGNRHEFVWAVKLGADRNESFAPAGRFPLANLRKGYLHKRFPPFATSGYNFGSDRANFHGA